MSSHFAFISAFVIARDPKTPDDTLRTCSEAEAAYADWRHRVLEEHPPGDTETTLARLEAMLTLEMFYEVSNWLRRVDVDKASSTTLVAILALTTQDKDVLFDRPQFVLRAERVLTERHGAERAAMLLHDRR